MTDIQNDITNHPKQDIQDDAPWFAVYTRSRAEKRLMELLTERGIEAYVPLQTTIHRWSDRKKSVTIPLIRSYCFVRVTESSYQAVLNTPGAVRYVWFSGKPAAIPDSQIRTLKTVTGSGIPVESGFDDFLPGTRVTVNAGPLAGINGELVSVSNRKRFLIRIDQLKQALTLSVPPGLLTREKA